MDVKDNMNNEHFHGRIIGMLYGKYKGNNHRYLRYWYLRNLMENN